MIKEAIGTAPTLDEARSKAITLLNAPFDADVIVEVLEQASKKTFGLFGGSPAKVRAYYEMPDEKTEKEVPLKEEKIKKSNKKTKPFTQKAEKAAKTETENAKSIKTEKTEETEAVILTDNEPAKYLKRILFGMGFTDASVEAKQTEEEILLDISSKGDYGNIIGRRGETLDALQYLVRLSVSRDLKENRRITLNIGDYRDRREETLKNLAKRQTERVLKYGRNSVLDPMNPYERRIIHTTVQEISGVESHSIGEGDSRRVVITPTGGNRFGGYNRGKGRQGGRGRDTRAPYKPEPREERAPKADIEGEFRFGKIEPKK
ncbi:MAG TPA: RNA-binding cell elongation regulator Jag/EloR [Clostridia bacterium]|nr:RNA-binding cell elongation regulator Jag/EloR [Clostridia bacterium]